MIAQCPDETTFTGSSSDLIYQADPTVARQIADIKKRTANLTKESFSAVTWNKNAVSFHHHSDGYDWLLWFKNKH
jgi:hypothetical protein